MKTRDTLIRLSQFRVDEARRKLAALEGMKADLERKARELETTVAAEQRRAIEDEIGRFAYPGFARSVLARRENITRSISELDRQIQAAHDDLTAAFAELKKFEIAEDTRLKAERAEMERRDTQARDDLTLTRLVGRRFAERG